jgi:hypothetical protein
MGRRKALFSLMSTEKSGKKTTKTTAPQGHRPLEVSPLGVGDSILAHCHTMEESVEALKLNWPELFYDSVRMIRE